MATTPGGWFTIVLWALYVVLFAPWWYCMLTYEKLEKKYKLDSDIRFGNTYEFFSKFLASSLAILVLSVVVSISISQEISQH